MKPLICPQCGGSITNYSPRQDFAVCNYCTTRFLIHPEKSQPVAQPVYETAAPQPHKHAHIILVSLVAVGLVFGGIIMLAVSLSKSKPRGVVNYPPSKTPTPTPRAGATPKPNPNLLEFGAEGTGNGMFQDADSIAVDSKGRIYVSDETLRVQQFGENGAHLKTWQIPAETKLYKRARNIDKIYVDDQDQLYVLVGGVVLVYRNGSSEPFKAINFAPDFIQDFAVRSDGGKLFVVNDGRIESLFHISPAGKTLKKVVGFHTETADAVMSPRETGIAAIRLATDGAGNIYSVYAFGDLGSYQLSYDSKEMMIFRFTPDGKFSNKFAQSMHSCGIEIDNQSRIYVTGNDSLDVYSNNGERVASVKDLGFVDAFALDKQNNIYFLGKNKVFKRAAITQ